MQCSDRHEANISKIMASDTHSIYLLMITHSQTTHHIVFYYHCKKVHLCESAPCVLCRLLGYHRRWWKSMIKLISPLVFPVMPANKFFCIDLKKITSTMKTHVRKSSPRFWVIKKIKKLQLQKQKRYHHNTANKVWLEAMK